MRRLGSVVMLALLAASAGAQQVTLPPDVQPGARVRATTPGAGSVTGRVVAANGDTLQVLRDVARDTVKVAVSRLATLDLSTGRHTRRWTGAAYGLLAGATLGAVIGAATYRKQTCAPGQWFCDYPGQTGDMAAGAVLLGTVGTVVGAIVGAGTAETWRRVVPPASAQLRLDARNAGGLALGASLRF